MTRRRWWLAALGLGLVGWIIGGEWVSIHQGIPENHFIDAISGLSFLLAGIVTLDRRPGNAIGWLLIAYVAVSYLGNWGNLQLPVLPLIGLAVGQQLGAPILTHIVLSYPTGRLRTRFERAVVGVIYGAAGLVGFVTVLSFDPRTDGCTWCAWEPAPFPSRSAVMTAQTASQRSVLVMVPLVLIAVWLRWRRSTPAGRRDLAPLWIGVCLVGLVYLMGAFTAPDDLIDPFAYLIYELQSVLQISLPIVLLWGLLSTRLARSAVGDLVMELGRPLLPGELRALLARAIGDPSLELVYALEGQQRWVDLDGRPVTLPEAHSEQQARTATVVERDGQPLAALIHDPALDQGLVRAAAAAVGMTIENERLQAAVRAQLEEVRASRQRIVEAGDAERRRVERNLHDGAQQRMATLALSLAMLRDRAGGDPALAASLDQAAAQLKQAISELRELARGIHPAILTEDGLPAAVESLADRSPLPVRVLADFDERLPESIEAIAYFVVSESLANVAKYACASGAQVELSRRDGILRVEVVDDGVGGADASRGSGLRGLEDRVSAVRGSFRVETQPGGGTRVHAEIPCDA
ncbi:MAG TPA: sensor histidine kinase [Streptosporangiaceae bacterium]